MTPRGVWYMSENINQYNYDGHGRGCGTLNSVTATTLRLTMNKGYYKVDNDDRHKL